MRDAERDFIDNRDRNIRRMVERLRAERLRSVAGSFRLIMPEIFEAVAASYRLSVNTIKKIYWDRNYRKRRRAKN